MTPSRILVTGGAGFIGSHTCVELLEHGFEVVVVDDFSNSSPRALDRVERIAGRRPVLVTGDIRDGDPIAAVPPSTANRSNPSCGIP